MASAKSSELRARTILLQQLTCSDGDGVSTVLRSCKLAPAKAVRREDRLTHIDPECLLYGGAVVTCTYRSKWRGTYYVAFHISPDREVDRLRLLTCTCSPATSTERCCNHAMVAAMFLNRKTVEDLVKPAPGKLRRSGSVRGHGSCVSPLALLRRMSRQPPGVVPIGESEQNTDHKPDAALAAFPHYVSMFRPPPSPVAYSKAGRDDDFYYMDHEERGVALIFNHVEFDNRKEDGAPEESKYDTRKSSSKDRADLTRCLQRYGFDVRPLPDSMTTAQVMDTLDKVSREEHGARDCLCVVVLSHGRERQGRHMIITKDGEYPADQLRRYFDARSCPSLADKPKLFFIQACRGRELNRPVWIFQYEPQLSEEEEDSPDTAPFPIPSDADYFIFNATTQGRCAWKNGQGSWFIQRLCTVLEEHLERLERGEDCEDFQTLMGRVQRRVSNCTTPPDHPSTPDSMQMPSIESVFRRALLLRPKAPTATVHAKD